jgi:hypothetical protein
MWGGGGSLWISRRRKSGTSHSRQAIYLLHTWILIIHFALFYYCFLIMHCFVYCYYSLYNNSWWLSSTSRLDIIYRDDTLDTWYVSNVSIIFDAPCLFLHHLPIVSLHLVALLVPQCQFPVFCCFCVSEVIHRKYSRNWMKQHPEVLFYPEASRDPNRSRRWATGAPHAVVARPGPWPCQPCMRAPGPTPDIAPLPI